MDQLSDPLRPRAIAFLLDLAERLRTLDLPIGANTKLKTPKLFIKIGTRRKDVFLTEILDEVPHKMTPQEERELRRAPWKQIPKHDRIPSGRLLLRVMRDGSHKVPAGYNRYSYQPNAHEFSDRKRTPLERQVHVIARAIKKGIDDDIDAREREEQQRAEAQAAYERQKAEERQTWESIRRRARDKALLEIGRAHV